MTDLLEYRIAERRDAPLIANLHAENWRRTYRGNFRDAYLDSDVVSDRQAVWDQRLKDPATNQCVYVACDGPSILGFICAYGAHDPKWGSFVDNLHVVVESQRRGIGATLMRFAGQWLSATYADMGVYLFVWELNSARTFYERLGGRNVEMLDVENPGGGVGRYFRYVWERPDRLLPDASVSDTHGVDRRSS